MIGLSKLSIRSKKGAWFIITHLLATLFFAILYLVSYHIFLEQDKQEGNKIPDAPLGFWYWLWFSLITQTTVGYGGVEDKNSNTEAFSKIKSNLFKIANCAQLISIFVITGYSL